MLKILDLILPYKSGRLKILGYDGGSKNDVSKIRRSIGLVFQRPESSFISKKVIDEVMFAPLNFNTPKDEAYERAISTLELFNLSEYEATELKKLSGGEKQRLMLASVFVTDPDIIILDEAFAFLDRISRELLASILEEKRRKGKGIISVTHDAKVASSSDRIILLKDGRVIKEGKSDAVLSYVPLLISSEVRPLDSTFYSFMTGGENDRA